MLSWDWEETEKRHILNLKIVDYWVLDCTSNSTSNSTFNLLFPDSFTESLNFLKAEFWTWNWKKLKSENVWFFISWAEPELRKLSKCLVHQTECLLIMEMLTFHHISVRHYSWLELWSWGRKNMALDSSAVLHRSEGEAWWNKVPSRESQSPGIVLCMHQHRPINLPPLWVQRPKHCWHLTASTTRRQIWPGSGPVRVSGRVTQSNPFLSRRRSYFMTELWLTWSVNPCESLQKSLTYVKSRISTRHYITITQ